MKNYYDKVLFVLGLLLLGLGVAFFFMKGGMPSGAPPSLASQPASGGAYAAVPTSNVTSPEASWEAAPDEYPDDADAKKAWADEHKDAQPPPAYPATDLWYYGVFTPPKIWWDPVAGWTALSPKPVKAKPPFALHLDSLQHRVYRIEFLGHLGSDDNRAVLQMKDTDNDSYFNARVGVDNPDKGVKVQDFKVVRETTAQGGIKTYGVLTLLDEKTNQTLTLIQDQPLPLPNDRYFLLVTDAPLATQNWEITKAGETLDVGDVNFKITKVDYDAPSVTVQRTQPNQDLQEQTLTPNPTPPAAPASTDATAQPAGAPATTPAPM